MAEIESILSPLLSAGFRASWVERIPSVETDVERAEAVARLMPHHIQAAVSLGGTEEAFCLCEQVHGNLVTPVSQLPKGKVVPLADGLCTNNPELVLGIHVADCGALYLADPVKKAVAVVHSGKVGTEKNILSEAITVMENEYGTNPADLIITLAPCIRPPAYEVDFAQTIKEQALVAGVLHENYFDCGICTTSDLDKYYSYRAEQGKTGRMLALIAI